MLCRVDKKNKQAHMKLPVSQPVFAFGIPSGS